MELLARIFKSHSLPNSSIYGTIFGMKRKQSDLTASEIRTTFDALYTAASAVRGRDAMKLFLRDLLTPSERIMLGRRIIIARLLLANVSYDDIEKELKVGRATIGRVHHWLEDQFPGYENALKAGVAREKSRREARYELEYGPFSYRSLKKKYPLHFLLLPDSKKR